MGMNGKQQFKTEQKTDQFAPIAQESFLLKVKQTQLQHIPIYLKNGITKTMNTFQANTLEVQTNQLIGYAKTVDIVGKLKQFQEL